MTLLQLIVAELIGLFIDDGFLAVVILLIVAVAAVCAWLIHTPLLAGAVLILGCVGVLVASALRARR